MNVIKGECRGCKQYGPVITVHHKEPYSHHKDYYCVECLRVREYNYLVKKDTAGRYYYTGGYICR